MVLLNRSLFRLDVSETDHGRDYWASQEHLRPDTTKNMRRADVIILPWENRGHVDRSFPSETISIFKILQTNLEGNSIVIASEPDDYNEIALHSGELRWPHIFITTVLFGAMANVLGDEIEKIISSPMPPSSLEIQLTVENSMGKCIYIDYKGPPTRLVDTIVDEALRCFPNDPISRKTGRMPSHREGHKSQ